jgi:uncharacterized damage-inducible protein DinB
VRRRYLDALLALPPAERLRDRGASYPSLQEIYAHVLDGYRYWFDLVPNDRAAEALEHELPARDLDDDALRRATEATERMVEEFLGGLGEADIAREVVFRPWAPKGTTAKPRTVRVGDILWHVAEEELQHRGELNALPWQIDVEPPIGTLSLWQSFAAPPGAGR